MKSIEKRRFSVAEATVIAAMITAVAFLVAARWGGETGSEVNVTVEVMQQAAADKR